jgi:hypothetical protein
MKKIFTIFVSVLYLGELSAQVNLVPNPSFEDTIKCPHTINTSTIGAKYWTSYGGTVDYFNACAPNNPCGVSVPYNYAGYQAAATGSAYCGFVAYQKTNIREYVGVQLTSPLVKNKKYNVSFKVSLAEDDCLNFKLGCNKLGLKFLMNSMPYLSNPPSLNTADVFTTAVITDTTNWTKISAQFVADTNYKYIVIGNLFNDANTTTLSVAAITPTGNVQAYYYLDDVSVTADTIIVNTTGIHEQQNLGRPEFYPNPSNERLSITLPPGLKNAVFVIYNSMGKIQITTHILSRDDIDISELSEGFYTVKIISEDIIYNDRIIIRR